TALTGIVCKIIFPGPVITIGGVFEDLPENSSNKYDIIVSMPSIGNFIWDGSMNWLGNERYYGYIKLYPGGRPEKVTEGIERMKTKYLPQEEMKKAEVDIWYPFYPIEELHRNSPEVKRMNAMLILLAFALIVTAVMNYLLIVVSAIMNRSKEIAVHKCYGAGSREIRRMALTESFIHLLLALLISMLLLLIFRDKVSELLGVSLKALFVSEGAILLTGICIAVFLLTGILSGYLYTRIPVATVFRNHKENRRLWKLGLLSIQFVAVGFLGSLLLVIGRQYSDMMHDEPGYSAENVIYIPLEGVDSGLRQRIAEELAALPEIEQVSSCSQLPFQHIAGNNIYLPETSKELFNGADFYNTGTDFLKMMKIPIIAGSNFSAESHTGKQVMVDRNFAEKMKTVAGWTDGVIGKNICITEHSQSNESYTICGVYENIRLGSIADQDNRPSFMFYRKAPSSKVIVKLKNQTPAAMLQIESQIRQLLPDREIPVYSWQAELQNLYTDSRHFRDAVMIGSIVTLLIALIGLIGYTNDELNRRRKEIAIRKVNGGSAGRILKLFLKEILTIAIPSLLTGAGSAAIVARHWQEQFSEKTPLSWYLFVSTILTALLIILAVMSWRVYRETNDNPIKALKSE
ncbi:MAG: FtsX-like permease family protein, partial [Bacteroidales bacterium]